MLCKSLRLALVFASDVMLQVVPLTYVRSCKGLGPRICQCKSSENGRGPIRPQGLTPRGLFRKTFPAELLLEPRGISCVFGGGVMGFHMETDGLTRKTVGVTADTARV